MRYNSHSAQWELSGISNITKTDTDYTFSSNQTGEFRIFSGLIDEAVELYNKSNLFMISHPENLKPSNTDLYSSASFYILLLIVGSLFFLFLLVWALENKKKSGLL